MANVLFYAPRHKGSSINDPGTDGPSSVDVDASGYVVVDDANTALVAAIEQAGGRRVGKAGAEEAVTAGTVQTAVTLSGLQLHNGAGASVIDIHDTDGTGTLLAGGLPLGANENGIFAFPEPLDAPGGVFIQVVSGALDVTTPGILIP